LLAEMLPEAGLSVTHETFAAAVNVNEDGPPAPTSMNLLDCGR
jgi:hypothetical protein